MLTPHQEEVLQKSLEILKNSNRLLIQGSAGVGKTFMVNSLIDALPFRDILCSAPTNKAVGVLMGKVSSPKARFSTTHSALKLKRVVNNRTGSVSFKPEYRADEPPLYGVKVLIVDEASMLNTELLSYLEEHGENKIIIFIGDAKQLPPVGEKVSPVFVADYPTVELTEIIRQGEGNPIVDMSRNIWEALTSKESNWKYPNGEEENAEGYVFTQNTPKIIQTLVEANGTDTAKFVAWTNAQVDAVNKDVREAIYGTPKKIEVGETLVFNAPYGDKYFTNQEVKVKETIIGTVTVLHSFARESHFGANETTEVRLKVYRINPTDFTLSKSHPSGILVIHEDSEKAFKEIEEDYIKQCKAKTMYWKDYYLFLEQFADMKYNHAITVHKSQGSTFERTIVDVGNICKNRNFSERDKMLYTAFTRTAKLLILYNA